MTIDCMVGFLVVVVYFLALDLVVFLVVFLFTTVDFGFDTDDSVIVAN